MMLLGFKGSITILPAWSSAVPAAGITVAGLAFVYGL